MYALHRTDLPLPAYVVSKGEIVYQSTPADLKNDKQKQNKYLGVEI